MSKETIAYEIELIKNSIANLKDALNELEPGNELSEQAQANIILVLSQLEDVRDIAFTKDDVEKTEIMKKLYGPAGKPYRY